MRNSSGLRPLLAQIQRLAVVPRAAVATAVLSLAAGPAPAQIPVSQGGQFRVNTTTYSDQFAPSAAVDADGDFVVAWTSNDQEGSNSGVYAQRYDAAGVAQGGEFHVNTYTDTYQAYPSVAIDPEGDFVVVWTSSGQDGSNEGVYAQLFSALGAPRGVEFRVNTTTPGRQEAHSVAMDSDGDFVVVWESRGAEEFIYGQRYDASGTPQGSEFPVNTSTTGWPQSPSVAMAADGAFVVAWSDFVEGTSTTDLYARQYGADGAPIGTEFRVNTTAAGSQGSPSVARNAGGDFVVVWESYVQDGSDSGVYGQRFNASGVAEGPEFRVNTFTTGFQGGPSVGMAENGAYVVSWTSRGQIGQDNEGYAQSYDAAGLSQGGEFRVNSSTVGQQTGASVGMGAGGDVVVVWLNVVAGEWDVMAQRYSVSPVASEPGVDSSLSLAVAPSPVGSDGSSVQYRLVNAQHVRLSVSDVLGREVAVLHDGEQGAGPHEARFVPSHLAPGVYIVRLDAGPETVVRRVTVAR